MIIMVKKDIDLDTAVTLIMGEMQSFRKEVNSRFTVLEADVQTIKEDTHHIRKELYEINRRLDLLEEQHGQVRGYAKEIDDLRTRVKYLEQQLLSRA